jgi:phospholipase C
MRRTVLAVVCSGTLAAAVVAACTSPSSSSASPPEHVSGGPGGTYLVAAGIHKIKHVIIVMQENRSFDTYFGTYPGADGIAMTNGIPAACVPNPAGPCVRPYHDTADVNGGGPHGEVNAVADVTGGRAAAAARPT